MVDEVKPAAPAPAEKPAPAPVEKPAATPAQTSSTSSSGGNKGCTTAIIIVVIILAVLGVGGYLVSKFFINKVAEKGAESLLGAATGAKVDIKGSAVSIKTDKGDLEVGTSTWPATMPSDVPKYSGGSINYATAETANKMWSVGFENIPTGAYDTYKSTLTSNGWASTNETDIGLVKTGTFEKGEWSLSFTVDSENKSAQLSVSEKI